MMSRYRITKKDGTHEVTVAANRFSAVNQVKAKYNLTNEDLDSVAKVSSKSVKSYKL